MTWQKKHVVDNNWELRKINNKIQHSGKQKKIYEIKKFLNKEWLIFFVLYTKMTFVDTTFTDCP